MQAVKTTGRKGHFVSMWVSRDEWPKNRQIKRITHEAIPATLVWPEASVHRHIARRDERVNYGHKVLPIVGGQHRASMSRTTRRAFSPTDTPRPAAIHDVLPTSRKSFCLRKHSGPPCVRHHRRVRADLRGLLFTPDPRTLPADAESFVFGAQLLVGPSDGPGEESFELTICSPEWLRQQCASGEPVSGLHFVIVGWDTYDERALRQWLEARVKAVEAETWDGITKQLRFLGQWEFDAYRN